MLDNYIEEWTNAYEPVPYETPREEEPEKEPKKQRKKRESLPVLVVVQLIAAALIVLSAFVLKQFGGEFYETAHKLYVNNLNNELIITTDDGDFDVEKLLDEFKN